MPRRSVAKAGHIPFRNHPSYDSARTDILEFTITVQTAPSRQTSPSFASVQTPKTFTVGNKGNEEKPTGAARDFGCEQGGEGGTFPPSCRP